MNHFSYGVNTLKRCQAAVEVPSWRIVPDYDPGTTEWKRPEDEYIKGVYKLNVFSIYGYVQHHKPLETL